MTPKQARFVQEYLIDLNATQAAVRAGYSARTAEAQGSRLLTNVKVAYGIQTAKADRELSTQIDARYVLRQAVKMHEKCLAMGDHGPAVRALELVGKHVNVQAFAEKVEHSGPGGGPIRFDVAHMTVEQLFLLEQIKVIGDDREGHE